MFSLDKLSPSITDMIRFDHSHVILTFHQYGRDKPASVKKALAETICTAVDIHATLEEEIFYPVMRQFLADDDTVANSPLEHAGMRAVIARLRLLDGTTHEHDKLLHELMRHVLHHVADEETVVLPLAEEKLSRDRLSELGAQMTRRRMELVTPEAGKIARNSAIGYAGSTAATVMGIAGALLPGRGERWYGGAAGNV